MARRRKSRRTTKQVCVRTKRGEKVCGTRVPRKRKSRKARK